MENEAVLTMVFNETVMMFIDDLRNVYPNDTYLSFAKRGVRLYNIDDPRRLQKAFHVALFNYYDQIMREDTEFFIATTAEQYKQDMRRVKSECLLQNEAALANKYASSCKKAAAGLNADGGSFFGRVVDMIKTQWVDMTEDNRAVVWQYIKRLVQLSEGIRAKTESA